MIEVRFTDIDSQGHASHLAIASWISHSRVKLFDDAILLAKMGNRWDHTMVHIDMDFMTEVTHPGTIGILPEVARIGGKSVTTKYEVHVLKDGKIGEAVARATCVNVFMYDGKPTRLPESLRDALRDV